MMKPARVHIHLSSSLHELVNVALHNARRHGNVALVAHQDLNVNASFQRTFQSTHYLAAWHEVGVDDLYLRLCAVDECEKCLTDYLWGLVGHTIHNAYHGVCGNERQRANRRVGLALRSDRCGIGQRRNRLNRLEVYALLGDFVPKAYENVLQLSYDRAFKTHVDVAPIAEFLFASYVVVGNVHTANVGYAVVNDYNLAVVAIERMVYPWKLDAVELHDFDASAT